MLILVTTGLLYITTVHGGTYTRWGRTTCAGDASPVYTGYMASSYAGDVGGGKNYICLISQPVWGNVMAGNQPHIGHLYGVQYGVGSSGGYANNKPFSWDNFNGQTPDMIPVPCVVCQTPNIDVIMVPGTMKCPADWYGEYSGYIVAAHYKNYANEYVCLDGTPEPGGPVYSAWQGGVNLQEIRCGVLPCGTYPNVNEVSCVVCSRSAV